MFKPLGLFAGSPCPDPSCHRHRCLFAHGETSKAAVPLRPVTRPSPRRGVDPELLEKARDAVASPGKKHAEVQAVAGQSVAKRLRTEDIPLKTVEASLEENRIPGTEPMPRPPDPIANRPAKPPSIPTSIRNSPQPWADRQKALQTLFIQFSKLYSAILPNSPDLAQRSALEQEAEISTSHPNLKGYKSAIHHAAVSIARRPKPGSLTHPSIGTLRESRVATEAAEKQKASRLTRDRVERYSLPLSDFSTWRYPDPTDSSLTSGGGEDPSAEGTKQTCSRCKVPFIVSSVHLEGRFGECRHHYGRIAPERIEGRRKWIYSCCRRERGEAGCEEGVHVFTDGEEDGALARRVGFRTVQQVRGGEAKDGVDVVGVDCEMICQSPAFHYPSSKPIRTRHDGGIVFGESNDSR